MQRTIIKSFLAAGFGVAVLAAAGVLEGSIVLTETYDLASYAAPAGMAILVAGAFLGDRLDDLGQLDGWEMISVAVAVLLLAAMHLDQPQIVHDVLADYEPWSGLAMAGVSYLGYWVVSMRS